VINTCSGLTKENVSQKAGQFDNCHCQVSELRRGKVKRERKTFKGEVAHLRSLRVLGCKTGSSIFEEKLKKRDPDSGINAD
jgi:hypothetical protein